MQQLITQKGYALLTKTPEGNGAGSILSSCAGCLPALVYGPTVRAVEKRARVKSRCDSVLGRYHNCPNFFTAEYGSSPPLSARDTPDHIHIPGTYRTPGRSRTAAGHSARARSTYMAIHHHIPSRPGAAPLDYPLSLPMSVEGSLAGP